MTQPSLSQGWTLEEISLRLTLLTKKELEEHFKPYVKQFLTKEATWLAKQERRIADAAQDAKFSMAVKNPLKGDMISWVSVPFLSPECFQRFRTYLPKGADLILETVALDGAVTSVDIKQRYKLDSIKEGSKSPQWGRYAPLTSNQAFSLYFTPKGYSYGYQSREDWLTLYWPNPLREMVLTLLFPEAPTFTLASAALLKGADMQTFEGETVIQEELPGLIIRLQEKTITLSKRGRPSIASVRSIAKKLKLQEFFPESGHKTLAYLRSRCLIGLLTQFPKLPTNISPKDIKALFTKGFTKRFYVPTHLLTYLKGIDRISVSWQQNQGDSFYEVINTLPPGQWIDYASLIRSLKAQSYQVDSYFDGLSDLYQEEETSVSRFIDFDRVNVHPYWSERLFHWPAFYGMTFAFAAWGLLDITYRSPDDAALPHQLDSQLNRIVAIRTTALGAYVLGQSDSYQSNVKPPFVLQLAADSLSILLTEGDQDRAAAAIQSFARPLGQQRFYSNTSLFLGDCKSPQDLQHKISLFTSIFPEKVPPNWTAFFDEMSQQVNPLTSAPEYLVLSLNPSNAPLLQLIARDPELKALSMKAEGYLILVKKGDLKKFKTRLQTFGYLLE